MIDAGEFKLIRALLALRENAHKDFTAFGADNVFEAIDRNLGLCGITRFELSCYIPCRLTAFSDGQITRRRGAVATIPKKNHWGLFAAKKPLYRTMARRKQP
jgi:hypothetical protein